MWLPAAVTTQATVEPVTIDEAKRQVRAVDFDDDDETLYDLIATARNHVEEYCGVYLRDQTVSAQTDTWCDFDHLPMRPVRSIKSVTYVDTAGSTQTLADTVYELRGDAIILKYGQVWPPMRRGSLITLSVDVGYAQIKPAVKQAILIRIADLYETRESSDDSKWTSFDSLLSNHRYY